MCACVRVYIYIRANDCGKTRVAGRVHDLRGEKNKKKRLAGSETKLVPNAALGPSCMRYGSTGRGGEDQSSLSYNSPPVNFARTYIRGHSIIRCVYILYSVMRERDRRRHLCRERHWLIILLPVRRNGKAVSIVATLHKNREAIHILLFYYIYYIRHTVVRRIIIITTALGGMRVWKIDVDEREIPYGQLVWTANATVDDVMFHYSIYLPNVLPG